MRGATPIGILMTFITTASALIAAPAPDGDVIELSRADRQNIEKYLGRGVVGKAVEAKPIDDPVKFLGLGSGAKTLVVRHTHGKNEGKMRQARVKSLQRNDGDRPAWSLISEDSVWYGEVNERGDVIQTATAEDEHGVISRFSPPEPVLLKGIGPGETRRSRIEVEVFDLVRQDRKKHDGHLDLVYTYVGAYEVTVPAGTFEAVLFKWEYEGKVGPANVKDDQYWFFAEGTGPIARVDMKDISAFLVYSDKSKVGAVLVERK